MKRADISRFIWDDGDLHIPACMRCKHLRPRQTCDAFPGGIPDAILAGRDDHRKPSPGDHGIRFEPVEPEKPGRT